MWESGAITSDSLYWNAESEGWKPIKELVEAPPPVLEEQPESGDEDWHVSNIALPVVNEALRTKILENLEPVQPKSPFKAIVFGTVMLVVIGVVVWGVSSLLTGKPKQEELSEAEKKKQKEYREAVARESAALAPTDEEIEEDKRLRDVKLRQEKSRRDSIIGTWVNSGGEVVFRADGTMAFTYSEGRKNIRINLTWKMAGGEIHVTADNGAIIIFRVLNDGSIQSYAGIDASGNSKIFGAGSGSPLIKIN
jgi:hypothetical protein